MCDCNVENSVHPLNIDNLSVKSSSNKEEFYKKLLNSVQSKDFHTFKNMIENDLKRQPPILNINDCIYPNTEETCLDIASRNGLTEFVKFLLLQGAKPNRVNEMYNRAPIHFAAEGGHIDILTALLEEPTTNPNLEVRNQTALHIAVRRNDLICARLLLEKGASASIPNIKGLTALHLAAMKGQRDMVELIIQKSRQCPDVDTYKDYNDQTTRDVIRQRLPDILLPPKSHENREVNVYDLKYYLITNDETNFLKSMELIKTEVLHSVAEELLEMTAQRGFHKATIKILKKLKGRQFSVKKAAEAAVLQSHSSILRTLLLVEPKVANDLVLNACQQLEIPERRKNNNTSDQLECLKLILKQKGVDINCIDSKGNTPLYYAVKANCTEAISLLLNHCSYIGDKNKFNKYNKLNEVITDDRYLICK